MNYVNLIITILTLAILFTGFVLIVKEIVEKDFKLQKMNWKKILIGLVFFIISFLVDGLIRNYETIPLTNANQTVSLNIIGASDIEIYNETIPVNLFIANPANTDLKNGTYTIHLNKSENSPDMVIKLTPNDNKGLTIISRYVSIEPETEFTFTIKDQEIIPEHECVKIDIMKNNGNRVICWDKVPEALSYKIYSVSDEPARRYELVGETSDNKYTVQCEKFVIIPVFEDGAGMFQYTYAGG